MFKKYDPRLLSSYRSYKLRDTCRLYKDKKLHDKTIRGWINTGRLEAFKDGNTILVHGATLKKFFTDNNSKQKRTLEFNQFRCGKCKKIDTPLDNIVTKITTGKNGCILLFGNCSFCGHSMNRPYKKDKEQEIMRCFNIEDNELVRIYGYSCYTSNTHPDIEEKTVVSELLKPAPILPDNESASSTSKAQAKNKELPASTSNTHHLPTQMSIFDFL